MTLDQIIDEVSQRANIDKLSQDHITLLIRWVNLIQQEIATRHPWPWLADREIVTTVTDKVSATGNTVAATNASATVTGTGTSFASTDVGRFIQFGSSNDWYEITAQSSATSLTITPAYAPTTETGMDYTIRTFYYNLSTNVDRVFDVRQYRTPLKLTPVNPREFDLIIPNQSSTGNPSHYYLFYYRNPGSSTGQQWALSFHPIPSAVMLIEVRFLRKLPNLTLGTDVSAIPVKWHNVLVDGATYFAYLWGNNPTAVGMKQIYELGVQHMIQESTNSVDHHYILQNIDRFLPESRFLQFPAAFQQPF